jgi:oligoendopeptidase F
MTGTEATAGVLPQRSEVRPELRWDIESVFATNDDWEAAFEATTAQIARLAAHQGRLGSGSAELLAGLRARDDLHLAVWKLATYANLRVAEDATNAASLALSDRAQGLAAQAAAASAFFEPELLAIDPATLRELLAATPELAIYAHYIERLEARRRHVRSREVEEVLAQAGEPLAAFHAIYTALADADLKLGTIVDDRGQRVELGQGNLGAYAHHADREVRRAAFEASSDAYLALKNTFAANYAGSVKQDVFRARVRGYRSALEAALAPEAIPQEVFFNLLDTVWRNLPVWQRYFRVRARLLGVEQAHAWDITEAPLQRAGAPPQRVISWDEGVELIAAALAPLGEEYVGIIRQGIRDRWVDAVPNAGKVGGAFSSGMPGHHPFILMSWHDELGSVSTLAHELGHSLHSYYAWQTQPPIYADYSMFAAEVASNMHQALMGAYLLETVDDPEFLITAIEERMGNNLRYLFTMPLLAKFEIDCHQRVEWGEALTADGMIATMADLYAEAYGDSVALDRDRMGITWARFPHLYANFYVFQYATGISAAAQLARQVRTEGAPAARRYLDFLRAGGSRYPVDALRAAGIDMRQPAPIQAAFDMLAGYVDRLEELIG